MESDEVDRAFPDSLGSGACALGGPFADVSCTAAYVAAGAAWLWLDGWLGLGGPLGLGRWLRSCGWLRLGGWLGYVGRLRRGWRLAVLAAGVLAAENES
jgi:hypothetical protein